ncbi:MAG: type II secretion system F family protein [Candidatus Omnitrophica bacterium]|nr:type II secretion system F family protein [Candidatus Omnitrophota bacterium]
MIALSALLFSISAMSVCWYFLRQQQLKSLVSQRVASVPAGLNFPFSFDGTRPAESNHGNLISLDQSYGSKAIRKLYLTGIRSRKAIKTFQWIIRLCYLIPLSVTFYIAVLGNFSLQFAIRNFVLGCALFFFANFYLRIRFENRQREISKVLPQLFDLMVVSLEAGLNFTAALPRVLDELEKSNPLVQEFQIMHHEYLGGIPLSQACDRLSRRCESPDLVVILSAIVESEQLGASLSNVLRIHSYQLRDKYRQRLREKAHQIPVKLVFPMMLIFITIFAMALGPSVYRLKNMNMLKDDKEAPSAVSATNPAPVD